MSTSIGPITNAVFDRILDEFKRKEVKNKLMETIVEPLIDDVWSKYSHYLILVFVLQIVIIILLVLIFTNTKK